MSIFSTLKIAVVTGIIFAVLSAIGGIYAKGYIDAKNAEKIAAFEEMILLEKRQRERIRLAMEEDAKKLAALEKQLAEYDQLFEDLEHEIADPDRECLDAADVERLRKLFGHSPD